METDQFIKNEPLVVTCTEGLDKLIGQVHDEFFILDNIKYDKDQQIVEIPYRRMFHGGPYRIIRNIFGIKRIEIELIRSLLIIRNVKIIITMIGQKLEHILLIRLSMMVQICE